MVLVAPEVKPVLDAEFRPAALAWRNLCAPHGGPVRAHPHCTGAERRLIYVFERTIARETSTTVTAVNLRFLEREVEVPLVGGGRFSGPY